MSNQQERHGCGQRITRWAGRGLVGAVIAICATTAHANAVINGDFATDASSWTYNNLNVDGGYLSSEGNPAGSFWVNHNGTNVGSDPDPRLSQVIATAVGEQYQLSFGYSGRIITGGLGLGVDIDGVQLATYQILNTNWLTASLVFTATTSATEIAFRSEINGSDYDARIDNVSVVRYQGNGQIPEPATLGLFGLGLAGLGAVRRRQLAA
jgi:hypothetical protein